MPPPKPPPPDPTLDSAPYPSTPAQHHPPDAKHAYPSTPALRRGADNAGTTPKSAPAAAALANGAASQRKKNEPTLLGDFLLGRPSPARVAAQRAAQSQQRTQEQQERDRRRKSMAAADAAGVREELRQEMRAATVRGLQQPGGVQARVRAWQKANAAALKAGSANTREAVEDAASEPTDVLDQFDKESVTEEDRLRIGMRQKAKRRKPRRKSADRADGPTEAGQDPGRDPDHGLGACRSDDTDHQANDAARREATPTSNSPRPRTPPKKRIVSDDNWMKRRKGKSPPRANAARPKPEGTPNQSPNPTAPSRNFFPRPAPNPSVQSKVKDWAVNVELPNLSQPTRAGKHYAAESESCLTAEEETFGADHAADGANAREKKKGPARDMSSPAQPRDRIARAKTESDGDSTCAAGATQSGGHLADDGIRVRPIESTTASSLPDDGIRVRPIETSPEDEGTRERSTSVERDGTRRRDPSIPRTVELTEDYPSEIDTPTKIREPKTMRAKSRRRTITPTITTADTATTTTGTTTTATQSEETAEPGPRDRRPVRGARADGMDDRPRRTPPRAGGPDPSADILFGSSALSDPDLPLGADARNSIRRPRAQRNPSLKAVPKVFKKVVSEGKKMIHHDRVDVPKPVINQPPNIESWLSNTVDPFVDSQKPESAPPDKAWAKETPAPRPPRCSPEVQVASTQARRESARSSPADRTAPVVPAPSRTPATPTTPARSPVTDQRREPDPEQDHSDTTPKGTPTSREAASAPSLKRSRATRSSSSPYRPWPPSQKKPFRQQLREVFRGESGGHKLPPIVYQSCPAEEEREHQGWGWDDAVRHSGGSGQDRGSHDDERSRSDARRRSSGSDKSSGSQDPPNAVDSTVDSTITGSTITDSTIESTTDSNSTVAPPPRRKPPTNGYHELSTILSGGSGCTQQYDDTASTASQTTATPTITTTYTEPTDVSRQRSRKSGLKRRLTKHSDLVSVLSLPEEDGDEPPAPSRVRSLRARRTLRRKTSKLDGATAEDLLQEFADDEHFYQKELKTLVDGAIPVLLTQVVAHRDSASPPADLFGRRVPAHQAEGIAKAVVSMGVALERLREAHKRVPLSDTSLLLAWLRGIHPLYDRYLDSWRLGFENLVVNLAPASASGRLDDDDSLVNAMPRNEDGDVLDHDGERVDVAHLLKRPLARIKWIVKFLRGAYLLLGSEEARLLLPHFERLQDKSHQRYREEKARKTDEDASNTDTSKTRDLRTLAPVSHVVIDRSRQVNAKDAFSLEFMHSNGRRIRCDVELIFRDNLGVPTDKGDVLVRETGPAGRSWLLFPPVPKPQISARGGDGVLTVTVRGTHNRREWCERMKLSAQDEEQVADWVRILASSPDDDDAASPLGGGVVPDATRQPSAELPLPARAAEGDGGSSAGGRRRRVRRSSPRAQTTGEGAVIVDGDNDEDTTRTPIPSRPRRRSVTPTEPAASPTSPTTPENDDATPSPERTPTQKSFWSSQHHHPLPPPPQTEEENDDDSEPPTSKTNADGRANGPYREDGAPPPPIHRTLAPKKAPSNLAPPVELGFPSRLKRRTSSPLKHEYHPSDISSSGSSDLSSDSDIDSISSSSDESDEPDELDSRHEPEVKQQEVKQPEVKQQHEIDTAPQSGERTLAPSVVSDDDDDDDSLTPSKSASQVEAPKSGHAQPEYAVRSVASVSYWSDRANNWKNIAPDACSIIITPGQLQVFSMDDAARPAVAGDGNGQGGGGEEEATAAGAGRPALIALDLTPYVGIRLSTVIDVEVRGSPISDGSLRGRVKSATFRFRTPSKIECRHLFDVACHSRENNTKFKALQEEARINAFGQQEQDQQEQKQMQAGGDGGDDDDTVKQRRRRSWFGRKTSYRASARAPSVSHGSSSGVSASSFLKRLTAGGNGTFDIGRSTLDKQSSGSGAGALGSRPGSAAGGAGGGRVPTASLYTSSGASSSDRSRSTFPRLPSISLAESSSGRNQPLGTTGLKVRLHLLVRHHKWADYGNCTLDITRPDPGGGSSGSSGSNSPTHTPTQHIRTSYHGSGGIGAGAGQGGKRVVVRSIPKKAAMTLSDAQQPATFVDLTVGSSSFSMLGNTGIVLSVWEEQRDADGNVGGVPAVGGISGGLTRWCLQCSNVAQCVWIMNLVTQEGFVD